MDIELCENPICKKPIETMAFKGTGLCSEDCKKAVGEDRSSVGTYMFLTMDEKEIIEANRNPDLVVTVKKKPKKVYRDGQV